MRIGILIYFESVVVINLYEKKKVLGFDTKYMFLSENA